MLSGTYFFLWLAGSAFVTALLTMAMGLNANAACLLFALSSVVAIVLWQRLRPPTGKQLTDNGLNNRLAHFVGRECVLDTPIIQGVGRIRLDDSHWSVTSGADDLNIPIGTRVRVITVNGMILEIARIV